jgi:RsiW-degrading membrane proteinase PrsW (M82 family)
MHTVVLLVVSIAPAAAFLLLILRMDRAEPEPLRNVMKIVALGGASAVVAALAEAALKALPAFQGTGLAGAALSSFVLIATVEEACKLAVVLLFAWRMPAFNEENDGIVYTGAAAIGFAALENMGYVIQGGLGVGVARAFLSVPSHVFSAVIMGLFVGRAKFARSPGARTRLVLAGFLFAWTEHGLYDTLALSGSGLGLLLLPLVGGVAALGILALNRGRRMSLLRWGALPLARTAAPELEGTPRPHRWMPAISRTLLAASALFWALLVLGTAGDTRRGGRLGETLLGGLLITFLPLLIGTLVEVSYQRKRRAAAAETRRG